METMHPVKIKDIHATLPARDLDRAQKWYERVFGLQPARVDPQGTIYRIGDNHLFVYPSDSAGTNRATAATIAVDDARRTAEDLRSVGVALEKYDLPGVTWENGLAKMPFAGKEMLGGWFKDSEGNIIAFGEFPMP